MHRIRSGAREHATDRPSPSRRDTPILPRYQSASGSSAAEQVPHSPNKDASDGHHALDGTSDEKPVRSHDAATSNKSDGDPSSALPPPAPPPESDNTALEANDNQSSTIEEAGAKPPWSQRAIAGSKRFANHTKDALMHSWINVFLVFVPVGIAVRWAPIDESAKDTVVFAMNAVAIVPLAGLLAHATESVASRMGDTWASLLNVTFGNAVELIIFIIALAKNQIRIVQASILGSILANLLLILGMAFVLGGLRFREQIYNSTVTQMSACLLSLSVTSLILPTAFHASFNDSQEADRATIKISRGTSVVLLLVYLLYLAFQLKSHAYMYESTPQNVIDEESHPGVLADFMNSSSSSDDSSSSDGNDTDTSSGSHTTAKSRIKRAFKNRRRRKSSASSTFTTSGPSSSSSPPNEKRSVYEDPSVVTGRESPASMPQKSNAQLSNGLAGGDDGEYDGDVDRIDMAPRVRDFQAERTNTGAPVSTTHKSRAKKQKKRGKKSERKASSSQAQAEDTTNTNEVAKQEEDSGKPKVGFAIEQTDSNGQQTGTTSTRMRPFAKRQLSRPSFRGPLPSLLSNTVFSTPPPPAVHGAQPGNMSLAHRGTRVGLRRTSSLPDVLTGRGAAFARGGGDVGANVPRVVDYYQRGPIMPMNQADVIAKDEDGENRPEEMSRTAAVVLLLCTTGLVAFCAELLVDAIPGMVSDTTVSEAFIGLIILPIVGNAAEHVTAVTVAVKNKMDLAIGVAVGSSIQIALFVTPFVVVLGWIMNKDMSLYFNLFETVSLFVTTLIVNFLILDGRSNYLEGSLLIAAYVIIAVSAFFYPRSAEQSELGGSKDVVEQAVRALLRL